MINEDIPTRQPHLLCTKHISISLCRHLKALATPYATPPTTAPPITTPKSGTAAPPIAMLCAKAKDDPAPTDPTVA
jgi:hypothetical protein